MAEPTTPSGYNYTCNECGASFEAMEDLTKHYQRDHPQSQQNLRWVKGWREVLRECTKKK